jgi:hypothetical protein
LGGLCLGEEGAVDSSGTLKDQIHFLHLHLCYISCSSALICHSNDIVKSQVVISSLNKLVQAVMCLIYIWEGPGSNLGWDT